MSTAVPRRQVFTMLLVLSLAPSVALLAADQSDETAHAGSDHAGQCFSPKIAGGYVLVYQPQPDVYSGPTTEHYTHGIAYQDWRPNDHTFIKGEDRRWHCFGITKPAGAPGETKRHEAEGTAFHAVAPVGAFADVAFKAHAFQDRPKLTVGDCGWAPFITKIGREYTIIGSHLGWATSPNLETWTDRGKLAAKGAGRDPNIHYWNNTYYLYRCANDGGVSLVTSPDFTTWSDPVLVFQPAVATWATESPSIIPYAGKFYLFWCLWDKAGPPVPNDGSKPGYGAKTYVYCSDKPDDFHHAPLVATLPAHAPEIFQDEKGRWYISSADYPATGVQVAHLEWALFTGSASH